VEYAKYVYDGIICQIQGKPLYMYTHYAFSKIQSCMYRHLEHASLWTT